MSDDTAIIERIAKLEERMNALTTLELRQTQEIHRRLDELNHAARVREQRDKQFVGIDKYDGLVTEFHNNRESVNKTLHELEGRTGGLGTARERLFQVLGITLVAAGFALALVIALWR